MDIQISSNFERLLFDLYGRDGEELAAALESFRGEGRVNFGEARWKRMLELFEGHRLDDEGVKRAIARFHQETGEILDPHSVIGAVAAERARHLPGSVTVSVATAHPAKFPDAVKQATGVHPALPLRMADLFERPERLDVLPNDLATVQAFVAGHLAGKGA